MIKRIKNLFYEFHTKKIYIDFLSYLLSLDEEEKSYLYEYELHVKGELKRLYKYSDTQLDLALLHLINSGFLLKKNTKVYVSQEGEDFVRDYNRFIMLGSWAKFTTIFNKNLIAIVSIISLVISINTSLHNSSMKDNNPNFDFNFKKFYYDSMDSFRF